MPLASGHFVNVTNKSAVFYQALIFKYSGLKVTFELSHTALCNRDFGGTVKAAAASPQQQEPFFADLNAG